MIELGKTNPDYEKATDNILSDRENGEYKDYVRELTRLSRTEPEDLLLDRIRARLRGECPALRLGRRAGGSEPRPSGLPGSFSGTLPSGFARSPTRRFSGLREEFARLDAAARPAEGGLDFRDHRKARASRGFGAARKSGIPTRPPCLRRRRRQGILGGNKNPRKYHRASDTVFIAPRPTSRRTFSAPFPPRDVGPRGYRVFPPYRQFQPYKAKYLGIGEPSNFTLRVGFLQKTVSIHPAIP